VDDPEFDWDENNVRHLAQHDVSPFEVEYAILDIDAVMLEMMPSCWKSRQTMGKTG
jgi:hypothetical protein